VGFVGVRSSPTNPKIHQVFTLNPEEPKKFQEKREEKSMSDYQSYPKNSTMALVSLIAGILGLTMIPFLGSIVAVITGPMAKKEIAESGGTLIGENLAQIGMILGWIGIGLGVIGCCIFAATFVLPFILAAIGIASEGVSMVAPVVFAIL
jgi:hypothetical protein